MRFEIFPNSMSPSRTSSNISDIVIGYLVCLASWMSGAPIAHGLTYVEVKDMGASLLVSIAGLSPLCCGDCLVEELPANLIVFGGVVITIVKPPA